MNRADFSHVTSMTEVERLIASGGLAVVLLLPRELGGEEVPQNIVYAPPQILQAQRRIIERIQQWVNQGAVVELNVRPEYRGDSLAPSRIVYEARVDHDMGPVSVLEVW